MCTRMWEPFILIFHLDDFHFIHYATQSHFEKIKLGSDKIGADSSIIIEYENLYKEFPFIQQSYADHLTPNWQTNINKLLSLRHQIQRTQLKKQVILTSVVYRSFVLCVVDTISRLSLYCPLFKHSCELNTNNIRSNDKTFHLPNKQRFLKCSDLIYELQSANKDLKSFHWIHMMLILFPFVLFVPTVFRGNCSSWHCSGYKFKNNVSCMNAYSTGIVRYHSSDDELKKKTKSEKREKFSPKAHIDVRIVLKTEKLIVFKTALNAIIRPILFRSFFFLSKRSLGETLQKSYCKFIWCGNSNKKKYLERLQFPLDISKLKTIEKGIKQVRTTNAINGNGYDISKSGKISGSKESHTGNGNTKCSRK